TLTIFGDGMQTRDFISVDKVVEANMYAGMQAHRVTPGTIFNVGSGKSITLLDLVAELKKEFPQYTAAIHFAPARHGDIRHSSADCRKFQEFVKNRIEEKGL